MVVSEDSVHSCRHVPDGQDPDGSDPDLSSPPGPPDGLERFLGAAVHAPPELPQLAPGDQVLGRFRIERLIGMGGMGVVYLATDPTLERQVAIKFHHGGAGTARLHREAVAMARLAHPNVIAVFEVGVLGEHAFVAMEYIAGTTLRVWRSSARRTVGESIAMLLGAGAGLAAAHDAGLVHRDFKPENVIVGNDGRPRVGDFGLARGSQSHEECVEIGAGASEPDSGRLSASLTRTGAVLGTPAYMAPEQLQGATTDARADQFAFCIVAWEMLYGERPFAGETLAELGMAIAQGPRRPPGSARVRVAIRRVLERGLTASPAARFPDMHELLAALRRASRSRLPLALGGAGVVVATGLAFVLVPSHAAVSCEDAGDEVAAVLPHELPARLLAVGGPFATDGAARAGRAIDMFAATYRSTSLTACRAANIDHAWSDDMYRRARACLTIRLRSAATLLAIDRVAPAEIPDVVQITAHLPVLETCIDPATLAASPPLPTDPMGYEAIVTARASLDSATVQLALGHNREARHAVARVAGTSASRDATIEARLSLVRAGIALADDHVVEGEQLYRDAYFAARAIDDVEVVLPAVGALIQTSGEVREDHEAADAWIRNGLADLERAKTRAPQAAAAVYTIAARVRLLEDNAEEALRLARLSLALVADTHSLALVEAQALVGEASCALGRYDECRAIEDQALAGARALLGPSHPRIASLLATMALERSDGTHPEALELATEAKKILGAADEASSAEIARTQIALAVMIINSDATSQLGEARTLLEDARRRLVTSVGAGHIDVAQVDGDLALLDNADGKLAEGAARLQGALAVQERALGPTATRVADTLYNLAATLRDLRRYDAALAAALRTVDINGARRAGTMQYALSLIMAAAIANLVSDPSAAYELATRALALPVAKESVFAHGWAAMEAGRALELSSKDPRHARALLQEARAVFVTIKSDVRVQECDALLALLR